MRSLTVGTWSFHLGDDPDAWKKNYDDSAWRAVVVPHDWSVELGFSPSCSSGTGYLPGGVGWYRAHVSREGLDQAEGERVRLVFHGVYKNADVWVNGYHLGSRASGYAEFSFDLTEILSYARDDDLVISVRVDHTDISDSRWYNGSGITRAVALEVHPEVGLAEHGTTFTTKVADRASATVRITQALVNHSAESRLLGLRHDLRSLSTGQVHVVEQSFELCAEQSQQISVTITVADPELWSDEDPNLYQLTTTITYRGQDSGAVEASWQELVGIRVFAFDPDRGFSINGDPRALKGVCLHEDAGCLGTAVPGVVWLRRLVSLKQMGCNAVRMAHNPHGPELYALCDALGFFVVDEAFDEWENAKNKWWQGHNVYPPRHEGYAKDFPLWHDRDLASMIDAHKNHPSIVAWSIGNEIDYPNDPYASPLFEEMVGNNDASKPESERTYDPSRPDIRRLTTMAGCLIDIVKRKDPTRPVTLAAAFPELSSITGLLDRLDVIGYNYKEHLYAEDHARFPRRPLLGSENSHGYDAWRAVADNEFIAGQFLWTGIDYLGEAHGWPVHGSGAGLLTLAGFDKHTWHLRQSWWTEQPVAYLVTRPYADDEIDKSLRSHPVARSWQPEGGQPVEVLCFSNCDELSLTCAGSPIPLTYDEVQGYWTAVTTVGAEPLMVEGHKDGQIVRDELVERGPAVEISARLWEVPAEWEAASTVVRPVDGGVFQIECTLVDRDGHPALGEAVVSAEVQNGALLGLENGDLADDTAFSEAWRRTLEGRLVVYVRGTDETAVRFTSPGLPEVVLQRHVHVS